MNEPIKIDNKGNYEGGYFVPNRELISSRWKERDDFFVTLAENSSLKGEIIELIRNAKSSIKLCSFIITDKSIFEEIQKVVNSKNVAVFILTQLDQKKFSTSLLSEEEMFKNFNQIHLDIIKKLYSNGVHVRATQTAHAKFIIADRERGLLTSANLTDASLTNNPESGIIINDKNTIAHLDNLFDEIFKNGTEYTKFISASEDKQFVISRESSLSNEASIFKTSSNLRFTYENLNMSLYEELVNTINKSSGDIFISTYSIVGLDLLPDFVDAISKNIERGKSEYIFSRGMNHRNDHLEGCTRLAKLGCKIYGDVYNHSKGIITPECGMIFTANIDGKHGLINGFEVGTILNANQKTDMESFIKWQIETAPYEFVLSPEKSRYQEYYAYHCEIRGINPMELSDFIVVYLTNSNKNLINLIDKTPCYLKVKENKVVLIDIQNQTYKAILENDILKIGDKIYNKEHHLESYLLSFSEGEIHIK